MNVGGRVSRFSDAFCVFLTGFIVELIISRFGSVLISSVGSAIRISSRWWAVVAARGGFFARVSTRWARFSRGMGLRRTPTLHIFVVEVKLD